MCVPLLLAKYYSVPTSLLVLIAIILAAVYYLIIVYRDTPLKEGIVHFVENVGKIIQK
jgi:hypothetical protein